MKDTTEGKKRAWIPEQIQRITVDFRKDKQGKEIPGSTFACMAKSGHKKLVSIPRLVYYLFVDRFKLNDSTWRIYYKDGNALNIKPDNLLLRRGVYSINKK